MDSDLPSLMTDAASNAIDRPSLGFRHAVRWIARNWFAVAFALLLIIPALVQFSGFDPVDPKAENRVLTALPAAPRSAADLLRLPTRLDSYLRDWFGLRQPMVRTNNWLRFTLFHEVTSPNLLIGRHGRIFMTSNPENRAFSLVNDVCGVGWTDRDLLGTAYGVTSLVARATRDFPAFTFLIIPGATILYPEDLPGWAGAPCRGLKPSVERTLDDLKSRPDILAHIIYPIKALRDLKRRYPIIPKLNLHWAGEGPLRYIEQLCEQRFRMKRTLSLPLRIDDWPSDLNRLNPGIGLVNRIGWPDLGAAGVSYCFGNACPPLDPDPTVDAPLDRFRAPSPNGKRLLILGDSFADNVAGDFTEYFGEVWHIHFNGLDRLNRQELDKLFDAAFRKFHPDQIIYICNDFGIFYEPILVRNFFWPNPAAGK